jgi:hypothetical protein
MEDGMEVQSEEKERGVVDRIEFSPFKGLGGSRDGANM